MVEYCMMYDSTVAFCLMFQLVYYDFENFVDVIDDVVDVRSRSTC